MPLYSSFINREVDGRKIELIPAKCSDLLLRGCTRGSPALCAGLFFIGDCNELGETSNQNHWGRS